MSKALIVRNDMDVMSLGEVLAKSGYFQDAQGAAQAVVKILAGQEMGFGPIASMTGINIIKGKVAPSANILAAAVKRSEKYDYTITSHGDEVCVIKFWQRGPSGDMVEIGESSFTKADAQAAGLQGGNWVKYPRNMMFARAMSNGARWYCPDILGGPVYTPDELGAIVDGETGEIIDAEAVEVKDPPAATNGPRPYGPAQTRRRLRNNGGWVKGKTEDFSKLRRPPDDQQEPPDERLVQRIAAMMGKALARPEGGDTDLERHLVLSWCFGVEGTGLLTAKEAQATAKWLEAPADEDGKPAWIPSGVASEECRLMLHQAMKDCGQQELDLGGDEDA
jgi:hypothetical protein